MAGLRRTTRFRFLRWLIRFIGVIVPRRFRARFRLEWEAELEYRGELLSRWDRLDNDSHGQLNKDDWWRSLKWGSLSLAKAQRSRRSENYFGSFSACWVNYQ
jgi:hypothetical protein